MSTPPAPFGKRITTDKLFFAQKQNDSSAIAEIVLPVIRAVRKFGHKVFGLRWTDREVLGDQDIDASSRGHPERAYRAKSNSVRSPYPSEKQLGEERDDMAPQAASRPR